ncbi:MAG: response regulator [Elusimicrobia bacterium]|nr:response regulator [Elusimicrobiota bacterium]
MTLTMPRVFTTFEVARICGVYHTTVINWVNKSRLKAHHTPGGHRRIQAADLVDFMQRHEMPVPADLAGRPKRILIVEDDPGVQRMLKRALQPLPGVVIQECADGLEALMAIGKEAPDLLVLDIRIPQVNGVEVCRLLKANENTQPIKVIAVTGEPLPTEASAFLKEHADGFFQKPLATAALRALAAELLDLDAAPAAAAQV